MKKLILVTTLLFAQQSFATTILTAKRDIGINAYSNSTSIGGNCSIQHSIKDEVRIIKKDSNFTYVNNSVQNTLLIDIAVQQISELGGSVLSAAKMSSLDDLKVELINLGYFKEINAEELLNKSLYFQIVAKDIIQSIGGFYDSEKTKTYKMFLEELSNLSADMKVSPEEFINLYREDLITIKSEKTKQNYEIICTNIDKSGLKTIGEGDAFKVTQSPDEL